MKVTTVRAGSGLGLDWRVRWTEGDARRPVRVSHRGSRAGVAIGTPLPRARRRNVSASPPGSSPLLRYTSRPVVVRLTTKNDIPIKDNTVAVGAARAALTGKHYTLVRRAHQMLNAALRAAVSVHIGPCCPALLELYSCKCAYCCIIGQIK